MPVFCNRDERRVFYVHVPKTGGTFIEDLFVRNGYQRQLWEGRPRRFGLAVSPQHYHRELYDPLVDLTAFDLKFMTVRHPVDRLVSEFTNHRSMSGEDDLLGWLKRIEPILVVRPSCFDNHLRPQSDFRSEGLLVVRLEDGFGPDWVRRFGEEHDLGFRRHSVPIRMSSQRVSRTWRPEEKRALLEFSERWYSDDFDVFGYEPLEALMLAPSNEGTTGPGQTASPIGRSWTRDRRAGATMRRARLAAIKLRRAALDLTRRK